MWLDTDADKSLSHEDDIMRPWVDRFMYPSTALQYFGDFIVNLLIATSGIALVILVFFLFA